MRELAIFAAAFAAAYLVVTKVAPAIQAKVESISLDEVWEIWDGEGWI